MSLIRNTLNGENPGSFRAGFALLVRSRSGALVPIWIYAGEPLRAVLFLACGLVAGVAANLAWRGGISRGNANAMTGISTIADKVLSWNDIATAIPDPAIVLDRSSVILNYNPAARSLFDRLRTGTSTRARQPRSGADRRRLERLGKPRETHCPSWSTRRRRPTSHRHRHAVRRAAIVISPVAILITIHDQSEQHRLLEMRSDFIANASHELRTPLASVRGFIETLQGPARDDEAARERFLAIMADQAERMTRLIDDLLLLSRVEEKVNLKPTGRVDLNEVIDDVVRSLTPAANERNMTIIVEPSAGPLLAMGDRDELFQVFHNLLENSVKYGRDDGTVRISSVKRSRAARGRLHRSGDGHGRRRWPRHRTRPSATADRTLLPGQQ